MNIKVKQNGNVFVLHLDGTVDINSANLIEVTGQLSKDACCKILCNMKEVDIVDNNGLSILAIAYKNVINKGSIMKFCNVPLHVKELLRMVRLDLVFDIYDSEDKAVQAFDAASKIDKMYLRRRFKRLEFYHPIKFQLQKGASSKKMSGKMLNISGDGVFVYTKTILPMLSHVTMELKLDDDKTYDVEGIIIWQADSELQPHCFPGMGIKFINITNDVQKEVLDFIDRNMTYRSDT